MNHIIEQVSFPVEKRRLYTEDSVGHPMQVANRMAVVRKDTDEVLSVVGKDYRLVPHGEVVEPMLQQVQRLGGELVERVNGRRAAALRLEGYGRRVWVEAKFGNKVIVGNDEIVPRMVFGNSYDTTSAVRVILGFFQIKCTNAGALLTPGRMLGFGGMSFSAHHTGKDDRKFDFQSIGDRVERFIEQFDTFAGTLRCLTNERVPGEIADEILKKYIGDRALAKKPTTVEDTASAWSLYAKVTNHLTIDFKGGQQPAEARAAAALREIMEAIRGDKQSA